MPDNLKYYFWQYNLTDHTTIPQTTPHTKYQPLFFKNSIIFPQIVPYHKTIGSFQNDHKISLKFN